MRIISFTFSLILLFANAYGYGYLGTVDGETLGDQYGEAVCALDFNNDGYDDLVVSAPAADYNGSSSGKVYIYYGGPAADTFPDLEIVGPASSFFGKALSSAGDFNNDGSEDLLIGAPFYDIPETSAGAAYLYFGGSNPDTIPDLEFNGENGSDYFGIAVAHAGDFNNDSYDDIVIGAYRADWGSFSNSGKAYIFYGGLSPDNSVDKILVGEADGERFGFSLTGCDFNGDNTGDIMVGAYSYDNSLINRGRMYLFQGSSSPDSLWDLTIEGPTDGVKFGWNLAAGNINGDSFDDVIMGTDTYTVDTFSAGKVYVFYGNSTPDAGIDDSYSREQQANDYLGFDVSRGVDIDNDGNDDFMAGMPGNDNQATEGGGAIILKGGGNISPDTTVNGSNDSEEMGSAVGIWQGYNNNNTFIAIAGAPGYDEFRGRIYLYKTESVSANLPPDLQSIGNKFGLTENLLEFEVFADDPDGDSVALSAENLPSGATFDDLGYDSGSGKYKGLFSWTPNSGQDGTYSNVHFISSDGDLTDDEFIEIYINSEPYICGDANFDQAVNVSDAVFVINYVFIGGDPPIPLASGEVNCDGSVNVSDAVWIINYVFIGGNAPCDTDDDGQPDC